MATFDSILTCNLGPSSLQLERYGKSAEGVYDDAGNRYGTRVRYECVGEISAASNAAMISALASWHTAASTDGGNFSITAQSSVKEQLLAADCIEGPDVKYQYDDRQGHNRQGVTFSVEGVIAEDTSGIMTETQSVQTQVNLEGLQTITTSGTVRTTGTPAASTVFLTGSGGVGPLLPAEAAGWQLTYQYTANDDDSQCDYSATQTEMVDGESYPDDGAGNAIVDGERTYTVSYDEHNRKITRYSYTFVGPYASTYLENRHTALRAAGGLRSASIATTKYKTESARGDFEILGNRDGDDVLELTETISHSRSGPLLREVRYPGTTPVIVQDEQSGYSYEQSGRAVGLQEYPQPPAYSFDSDYLADPPEITLTRNNDNEFETS